jgi:hypothetical protein
MTRRPLPAIALTWTFGLAATRAGACGLTPPIGPNGLPTVCHGDDARIGFRAGLAGGGTSTRIDFGAHDAELLQAATTATLDVFPTERLGLSVAAGVALVGRIDYLGQRYDLLPGPIGGVGVSYRLFGGEAPFVHGSFTLSIARATSRDAAGDEATFTSRDYRLGVAVGKALGTVAAPFAVFRYFGAGTNWKVAGGHGADAYRYQLGAGSAFALSERVDALVELAFLGEKRATLGAGYAF